MEENAKVWDSLSAPGPEALGQTRGSQEAAACANGVQNHMPSLPSSQDPSLPTGPHRQELGHLVEPLALSLLHPCCLLPHHEALEIAFCPDSRFQGDRQGLARVQRFVAFLPLGLRDQEQREDRGQQASRNMKAG